MTYALLAGRRVQEHDLEQALVPLLGEGAGDVVISRGRELVEQGLRQGQVMGRASALDFLAARGVSVPDSARERIEKCTDTATLKRWIARAVGARSIEDVFGED